ncbi:hypothetical protein AAVH_26679 [Aphelenchoides avenae]|nr:hypothetical protein AAVH_26679 [Aphelenchus avenae]
MSPFGAGSPAQGMVNQARTLQGQHDPPTSSQNTTSATPVSYTSVADYVKRELCSATDEETARLLSQHDTELQIVKKLQTRGTVWAQVHHQWAPDMQMLGQIMRFSGKPIAEEPSSENSTMTVAAFFSARFSKPSIRMRLPALIGVERHDSTLRPRQFAMEHLQWRPNGPPKPAVPAGGSGGVRQGDRKRTWGWGDRSARAGNYVSRPLNSSEPPPVYFGRGQPGTSSSAAGSGQVIPNSQRTTSPSQAFPVLETPQTDIEALQRELEQLKVELHDTKRGAENEASIRKNVEGLLRAEQRKLDASEGKISALSRALQERQRTDAQPGLLPPKPEVSDAQTLINEDVWRDDMLFEEVMGHHDFAEGMPPFDPNVFDDLDEQSTNNLVVDETAEAEAQPATEAVIRQEGETASSDYAGSVAAPQEPAKEEPSSSQSDDFEGPMRKKLQLRKHKKQ